MPTPFPLTIARVDLQSANEPDVTNFRFDTEFVFHIDCIANVTLEDDIDWKVTYYAWGDEFTELLADVASGPCQEGLGYRLKIPTQGIPTDKIPLGYLFGPYSLVHIEVIYKNKTYANIRIHLDIYHDIVDEFDALTAYVNWEDRNSFDEVRQAYPDALMDLEVAARETKMATARIRIVGEIDILHKPYVWP